LSKVLSDLQKQLAENQAKLASGSLKDTSLFKKLKYQISLIKTHLSSTHVSPS
jgi:ribosomal protein L29